MARSRDRLLAQQLRSQGKSIKEITKILEAAQSTVSLWCRNIKLTPPQIAELERRTHDPYYGRRLTYLQKIKNQKELQITQLTNTGIKEIGNLNKRELLLIGIALYWAEGFKKDSQVGFASSDPKMIRFFIKWLQECFNYKVNDLCFRITINISHQDRLGDIQQFWEQEIGNASIYFQKPFFQKTKWQKIYENRSSYFGVLRIRVRKSSKFLRRIHGWIEGLKRNAM